ncbi:MAG: hypothetical protein WC222_04380 [Parachlamydiales bacterium]|jgi:hypothetical protein
MKKIINSLGLILLAAAAGYSAYWYVLANKAETAFKESVAEWQKENNIETVTYDSLSKEGFPSHINLRLENVKVKKHQQDSKENFEVKVDGSLTLSIPLWQKERLITSNGTTTIQSEMLSQTGLPHTLVVKGKTALALEDGNSSHFDILKNVLLQEKNTTQDMNLSFLSFKSNLEEMSFNTEINEKTPLQITSGPLDIKVNRRDYKEGQQDITYSLYTKDLQVKTPDSVEVLSTFYYNPTDMGKTQVELEGSVCYPEPGKWEDLSSNPFQPRKAEACFKLDKFSFNSEIYTSTLQNFVLSLLQDNTLWTLTFKGFAESTYTEKYDQAIRRALSVLLKSPEFAKTFVGDNPKEQEQLMNAREDIIKLIPALHEFGKITNKVDFIGSADMQNNVVEFGKFDLSAFDYIFPPYALSITTKGDFKNNFSDPNVNGLLKITRYKQLVENLTDFYNKVVQVYNKYSISKDNSVASLSPEAIKKTLTFLNEISDDPAKDTTDLRVTFVYNDQDHWKVGTLKLPEFLGKAFELYGTLVPTPAPAPVIPPQVLPAPNNSTTPKAPAAPVAPAK